MPDAPATTTTRRRAKAIHVNERYCSGCGICVQYCPQKVLAHFKEINAKGVYPATAMALDKCTVCRLCELYCGSFAIAVEEE